MFNFEAKVIVEFGDIAHFVGKEYDVSWNEFHNMVFTNWSPFHDTTLIGYDEIVDFFDDDDQDNPVIRYFREFMEHIEVDEFYWVAK